MKKGLIMVSMNKKRVIKSLCAAAFLGALIAYPQSSFAEVPVPTLDRVKTENTTFINSAHSSYTLTELTADTTAPEGSIIVNIGDKEYYYIPNEGDDIKTLQLVAATGNAALVETTSDKALYTTSDGKYYTYNTDKLPNSGYKLTPYTKTNESDPLPDDFALLVNTAAETGFRPRDHFKGDILFFLFQLAGKCKSGYFGKHFVLNVQNGSVIRYFTHISLYPLS